MAVSREQIETLVQRLLDEYKTGERGSTIDPDRLREIVSEDPNLVATAFDLLLRTCREGGFKLWGLLWTIAESYREVTDDDSLQLNLQQEMKEAGVPMPKMSMIPAADAADARTAGTASKDRLVILEMASEDLVSGSAYRIQSLLSAMAPDRQDTMLGRCVITFPVDQDPRLVCHIPQVRTFVEDLHKRMPHFPMYLNFRRELGMHTVYYGSLADQRASRVENGNVALAITDDSVILPMRESLRAIRPICDARGIPLSRVVDNVLGIYSTEQRARLFGEFVP